MGLSPRVEQLIDECFADERVRDCESCPAARWKTGGTCCFGDPDKRDEDTSQCRTCHHFWECGEEVKAAYEEDMDVYTPRMAKTSSKPTRFTANPSPQRREQLVQLGGLKKKSRPVQRQGPPRATRPAAPLVQQVEEALEQPLAQRWMKDTIWGGFHGMSQASSWFFENYYWE